MEDDVGGDGWMEVDKMLWNGEGVDERESGSGAGRSDCIAAETE